MRNIAISIVLYFILTHGNVYIIWQLSVPTLWGNITDWQRIFIQTCYKLFVLQHLPTPQGTQVDRRMPWVRPRRLEQELQPRVET